MGYDCKSEFKPNDAMLNRIFFSYREREGSVAHLELKETEYVATYCCKNMNPSSITFQVIFHSLKFTLHILLSYIFKSNTNPLR